MFRARCLSCLRRAGLMDGWSETVSWSTNGPRRNFLHISAKETLCLLIFLIPPDNVFLFWRELSRAINKSPHCLAWLLCCSEKSSIDENRVFQSTFSKHLSAKYELEPADSDVAGSTAICGVNSRWFNYCSLKTAGLWLAAIVNKRRSFYNLKNLLLTTQSFC